MAEDEVSLSLLLRAPPPLSPAACRLPPAARCDFSGLSPSLTYSPTHCHALAYLRCRACRDGALWPQCSSVWTLRVYSAHFSLPDRIPARRGCTRARALSRQAMKAANMSGPVLVGLQEELDKVKAAAKTGTTALVKHIIKAHPPKSNQEVQLDFSEAGASYDHVCVCCVGA